MHELVEYVLGKSQRNVNGKVVYDEEAMKILESIGVKFTFTEHGVRWTFKETV